MTASVQPLLLALDQGTSSSRAVVYDLEGNEVAVTSRELQATFPHSGWVEEDPREIWRTQREALEEALSAAPSPPLAIGVTNQRETVLAWDPRSGEPVTPAIVWQCRRTAPICEALKAAGHEPLFRERTGLLLDPYFSGTKIRWLLDETPGLADRAVRGEVVFGTVDSWLLFKLTGVLGTDITNASRTLLCNLQTGDWDDELLGLLGVPRSALPPIRPSAFRHGTASFAGHEIPVSAILGDQQASLLGHGCLATGQSKCTFGTGAFLLAQNGRSVPRPSPGVLGTVAWSGIGEEREYALEGSVFVAGALIQWLRDKLGVLGSASESERVARQVPDAGGVIVVPAFVGLGAPYWDAEARGAIFGLTRESSAVHIVRASLDAVAQQVADLLDCPEFAPVSEIRIDGGMSRNSLFCELLADATGRPVAVTRSAEVTARGVALLAGVQAGVWPSLAAAATAFRLSETTATYAPRIDATSRNIQRARWHEAVRRVRTNA